MVGIVIARARLSAKSLIGQNFFFQSSCTYAVKWQFLAENQSNFCLPASLIDPILKSKACCSFLLKESNYRPDRVYVMGCTVNNLLKL
jgi:hypothetical protein